MAFTALVTMFMSISPSISVGGSLGLASSCLCNIDNLFIRPVQRTSLVYLDVSARFTIGIVNLNPRGMIKIVPCDRQTTTNMALGI